ncbi:hypothetical protein LL912_04240 [Niabella sp. CC-SYL272]|uniref:hypothetical protein n=1 Tax=Niabella agricola TaxID=2891571 RepID=UPI001F260181|nr:hypothetical protein [Niabella agricola]MCF3107981.1 hypothetical protein [Niabella agricola]
MKLKMTLCVALAFTATALFAQSDYKQSIGLRFGSGYYDVVSAAYKTFLNEAGALEVNAGFHPYGVTGYRWVNASASVSYQHHFPIKPVDGLKWFVGGGVVAANSFSSNDYYKGFSLGLFPTAGADYKFSKIPLAVSADVRPTIHVVKAVDYHNSFYPNAGVSARYTF